MRRELNDALLEVHENTIQGTFLGFFSPDVHSSRHVGTASFHIPNFKKKFLPSSYLLT